MNIVMIFQPQKIFITHHFHRLHYLCKDKWRVFDAARGWCQHFAKETITFCFAFFISLEIEEKIKITPILCSLTPYHCHQHHFHYLDKESLMQPLGGAANLTRRELHFVHHTHTQSFSTVHTFKCHTHTSSLQLFDFSPLCISLKFSMLTKRSTYFTVHLTSFTSLLDQHFFP